MTPKDDAWLVKQARAAQAKAYAPYSGFSVGAALEDENGQYFSGCNVENASFGATCCAEQVAIFKAISAGSRKIRRLAVTAHSEGLCMPCGICRQVMMEFALPGFYLLAADGQDRYQRFSLDQLLPHAFGPQDLA